MRADPGQECGPLRPEPRRKIRPQAGGGEVQSAIKMGKLFHFPVVKGKYGDRLHPPNWQGLFQSRRSVLRGGCLAPTGGVRMRRAPGNPFTGDRGGGSDVYRPLVWCWVCGHLGCVQTAEDRKPSAPTARVILASGSPAGVCHTRVSVGVCGRHTQVCAPCAGH